MKISIRKAKSKKVKKTKKSSKAKKKFKLPKLKFPKVKLPKVKLPKMKLPKLKRPKLKMPKFKKMGEEHFVVMILAVVAVIAVVGLFMYTPTAMNATGAASYPAECDFRCGYDEVPAGFTYLGSGNVECLCKKVG